MKIMRSSGTSTPILPVSWQAGEFRTVLITVGVCCWIALWSSLERPSTLVSNLITTNVTGLSIWLIATLIRLFLRGRLPAWGITFAILAGTVAGPKLASFIGGVDLIALMLRSPAFMRQFILSNILIGIVVTAFFLYFSHTKGVREALERERRRVAEALQAETAARLALLQAQIEPHFLFNTLANIHSLIKEDPDTASLILEQLNSYLRTSLRRTRERTATVGEELELIDTLLGIAGARLGARLDYRISAAPELHAYALPPLLLQPLVENAIRHGIEPSIAGGKIHVEVIKNDGTLELTVKDTGIGLNENAPEGVGMSNVRARLSSLYGTSGKLILYTNVPQGVIATLIIPATTR
jgi:signal transduction histidine kinase